MVKSASENKNPLVVSPDDVQEYEKQSGLIGICQILEQRGLIKIVPANTGGA